MLFRSLLLEAALLTACCFGKPLNLSKRTANLHSTSASPQEVTASTEDSSQISLFGHNFDTDSENMQNSYLILPLHHQTSADNPSEHHHNPLHHHHLQCRRVSGNPNLSGLCPFVWRDDFNVSRIPQNIPKSRCLCDNGCLNQNNPRRTNIASSCQPITINLKVLMRGQDGSSCVEGFCRYELVTLNDWPVGCHCVPDDPITNG